MTPLSVSPPMTLRAPPGARIAIVPSRNSICLKLAISYILRPCLQDSGLDESLYRRDKYSGGLPLIGAGAPRRGRMAAG
jgi:hypothetical protein